MDKRVVVTGIGSVSSLGNTIEEMLYSLNHRINKYEKIPDDRFLTNHKLYRNNRGFIIDQELYSSAVAATEASIGNGTGKTGAPGFCPNTQEMDPARAEPEKTVQEPAILFPERFRMAA